MSYAATKAGALTNAIASLNDIEETEVSPVNFLNT